MSVTAYAAAAVTALPFGAAYALQGTGIVLVFRTTRVFNFAQAGIGIVAAYTAAEVASRLGGGHLAAFAGAGVGVAAGALLGVAMEWTSVRRARGGLQRTIVTLGWLLALQSAVIAVYTQQTTLVPASLLSQKRVLTLPFVGTGYGPDQLLDIALAVAVALGLAVFLRFSAFGVAMRAVADDPEAGALLGLRVSRVLLATWGLGGAVAGLAGVLIAPLLGNLDTFSLFVLTVQAIAAAIVGGLVSLPLTLLGGFGLAVLQEMGQVALPKQSNITPYLVAFLVVLAGVLLRRSSGRADVSEGGLTPQRVKPLTRPGAGAASLVRLPAIAVVLFAAVLLLVGQTGALRLGLVLAWTLAGMSVVLLTGVAGQVSVCQGVFMGIGGVAASAANSHGVPFLLALLIGAAAAAAAAAAVGIPALRLEPLELAVVTVAFAFAADGFLFQWAPFTNSGQRPLQRPSWADGFSLSGQRAYAVLCAAVVVAVGLGIASLRRARTGAALTALRSSAAATAAMGFSPVVTKVVGFAASGAVAGLAGVLLAGVGSGVSLGSVSAYDTTASITLLAYAIIAGVGNVPAALLTGLLVVLPTLTASGGTNDHVAGLINLASGALLVVVVIVAPQGLAGLGERVADSVRRSGAGLLPQPQEVS